MEIDPSVISAAALQWGSDAYTDCPPEFAAVAEHLALTAIDYMSINDLLELGGYQQEAALRFILMNMFAAMKEGSVCLLLEPAYFLEKYPPGLHLAVQNNLTRFLTALRQQRYRHLIAGEPDNFLPLIYLDDKIPRLYFQKYHACESDLMARLATFRGGADGDHMPDKDRVADIIEELYSQQRTIRIGPQGPAIVRDPIQEQALKSGLTSHLTIISGGPGTGKTSLMVNLLRGLLRCGIAPGEILLGAPTGRAAQRMTEAIAVQMASITSPTEGDMSLSQLKGATIHRLLRYDPRRHRFLYNAKRLLPVKVVIVDEVSMVDLVMMDNLLKALAPQKTRLIFLGDKNQLPSVEAGSVLADLIPTSEAPNSYTADLVILKTVFRSGRELTHLAKSINTGKLTLKTSVDFETAMQSKTNGWHFITDMESEPLPDLLFKWALHQYFRPGGSDRVSYLQLVHRASMLTTMELEGTEKGRDLLEKIFVEAEKSRILTLTRVGPFGCEAVNSIMGRLFAQARNRQALPRFAPKSALFPGVLIIIRKNDYAKELFNGDVGVVLADSSAIMKIYFRKAALYFSYSADLLPSFESAFALTVHQSQGSEFRDVLVVLPDDLQHRLLTREMLYTAVTRAQQRVVVYGRKSIFLKAVSRRIQRQTGML